MAGVGIKLSATDDTKGAFDSILRNLGSMQSSATSVKSALSSIGVGISVGGFVAFTKSIVDGLDALNDLKDATGASIENISALEDIARRTGTSFDTVGTSLVKLNQALNTAKPGSDTEKAIAAIGLSVKDLKALDPAEAFRRIAVELNKFADDGNKARLTQELFGKSLKEVAPLLKDVADAGKLVATVTTEQAQAAEDFNKQLFALQKNAQDAGRSLVNDLLPTLNQLATEWSNANTAGTGFASVLSGSIKTALETISILAANVSFVFGGVGREVGAIAAQIAALATGDIKGFTAISDAVKADGVRARKELDALEQRILNVGKVSAGAGRGAVNPAIVSASNSVGDVLGGGQTPAQKAAAAAYAAELKKQADLVATLSGVTADYDETLTRLQAIKAKGMVTDAQYVELVNALIEKQPMVVALRKEEAEALKEATKQTDALRTAQIALATAGNNELFALRDKNEALRLENEAIGLSAEKLDALILKRMDMTIATQEGVVAEYADVAAMDALNGTRNANIEVMQREIDKLDELKKARGLTAAGQSATAAAKAADAAKNEWTKATEKIEQDITDALMRGFESGKGFGENLRDTLQNMFKTMVLKPVISAIVKDSGLSNPTSLSYLEAATNFKDGSYGKSIGQGIGTAIAGPIGGQIGKELGAIVDKWFSKDYVESLGETVANITAGKVVTLGGSGGSNDVSIGGGLNIRQTATSDAFVNSLASSFIKAASALGASTAGASFGAGFNNSDGGKFAVEATVGGQKYDPGQVKYTDANLQLEASRAVFFALQSSDMPAYLAKVFDGVTASTASQQDIDAALNFAGSLKKIRDSLTETRTPLDVLKDTVATSFASLGTSAETFKTDFVAAIDGGISADNLVAWQTLGTTMDALAVSTKEAAAVLEKDIAARASWQDKIDLLTGKVTADEQERANALKGASVETAKLISTYYDLKAATATLNIDFVALAATLKSAQSGVSSALQAIKDVGTNLAATINTLRGQATQNLATAKTAAVAALTTFDTANTAAQASLKSALTAVVDSIAQAAADVANAQTGVDTAKNNITKGYLNALDVEAAVKKKINDKYFNALDAVAAATNAAADSMRSAVKDLMGALDDLNGSGGNAKQNYSARKSQFEALTAAALGGDAQAISKLRGAGSSFIDASKGGASTSAQFQSDRLSVSTVLAQVLSKFGSSGVEAESPLVKAQRDLAAATVLATAGGVTLQRSQDDLAGELSAAVIEVAKWSSAITVSGAANALVGADVLAEYNTALTNLTTATAAQTALTTASSVLDLTGVQRKVNNFAAVVATAIDAQNTANTAATDLATAVASAAAVGIALGAIATPVQTLSDALDALALAQTEYEAVQGDLYNAADDLVTQYGLAYDALVDFTDRTAGLDFSVLADLDPLGGLLQEYATALETLYNAQTAQTAAATTPQGQIDALYVSQLGRHLESGTFNSFYKPLLDAGATMADVLTSIQNTALISDWANLTSDQKVDWLKTQGSTKDFSVEYLRGLLIDGSHAGGLARVPFDGYMAQLHEGERVLTAADNALFNQSRGGNGNDALLSELQALREEVQGLRVEARATASYTNKTSKILERVTPDGASIQMVAA